MGSDVRLVVLFEPLWEVFLDFPRWNLYDIAILVLELEGEAALAIDWVKL